ncbi:MAG: hypothetical protein AAB558_02060 [Patescibacteria group bacterium]
MPDITAQIGVVAGLGGLAGYVPYILAMRRGKTHPSRAGWWIWTGVGFMLLLTSYSTGTRDGIWVPLAYVVGPLVVALYSFKHGEGGWEFSDKLCLLLAATSIFIWWSTGSAELALAASLVADTSGAWPTLKKAYLDPAGEDRTAWGIWFPANTLNLLAVHHWTPILWAYPVYMVVASGLISACVFFRPRRAAL